MAQPGFGIDTVQLGRPDQRVDGTGRRARARSLRGGRQPGAFLRRAWPIVRPRDAPVPRIRPGENIRSASSSRNRARWTKGHRQLYAILTFQSFGGVDLVKFLIVNRRIRHRDGTITGSTGDFLPKREAFLARHEHVYEVQRRRLRFGHIGHPGRR